MQQRGLFNYKLYVTAALTLGLSPFGIAADQTEKEPVTFSLYVDNDLFTGNNKDGDYTGGIAVAFSGEDASKHPFSIDRPLAWISKTSRVAEMLSLDDAHASRIFHTCEVGLVAFTPTEIKSKYSSNDIEPLVYEGWLGVGCEFTSGIRLSYLGRHQSSELKTGSADHSFTYGEFVTSYKF